MNEYSQKLDQAVKETTFENAKYLTFKLAAEEYGIGILKVKEIIGMMHITEVPRTPAFMKGVINLRGKVIPVVDLRLKFQMTETPYNEKTCIIIVEVDSQNVTVSVGIIVDSVSEVLNIQKEDIEPAPEFGNRLDTAYILGMAKTENAVKILLDIDKVLNTEEISLLDQSADRTN